VHDLTARGIGFKVLTGHGASIDTTFPDGKLVFGIFAALAELERTIAGMAVARARGRNGGRPDKMAPSKLRLAVTSMNQPGTRMGDVCAELGITLRMRRSITPTHAADRESSLEVRLRGPQSIMVRRVEEVINTLILKAQAPV